MVYENYTPDFRGRGYSPRRGLDHRRGRGQSRPYLRYSPYLQQRGGSHSSSPIPSSSSFVDEDVELSLVTHNNTKRRMPNKPKSAGNTPKPSGILVSPIFAYFEVLTRPSGIQGICPEVWDALIGRDQRMSSLVTNQQLQYVTTIAYCNKISQCAIGMGYARAIPDLSLLKTASKGIQLPGPLARYRVNRKVHTCEWGSNLSIFCKV